MEYKVANALLLSLKVHKAPTFNKELLAVAVKHIIFKHFYTFKSIPILNNKWENISNDN